MSKSLLFMIMQSHIRDCAEHKIMIVQPAEDCLTLCTLMGFSFRSVAIKPGIVHCTCLVVPGFDFQQYYIILSEALFNLYKQCRP